MTSSIWLWKLRVCYMPITTVKMNNNTIAENPKLLVGKGWSTSKSVVCAYLKWMKSYQFYRKMLIRKTEKNLTRVSEMLEKSIAASFPYYFVEVTYRRKVQTLVLQSLKFKSLALIFRTFSTPLSYYRRSLNNRLFRTSSTVQKFPFNVNSWFSNINWKQWCCLF